jgi:hypothetical protein
LFLVSLPVVDLPWFGVFSCFFSLWGADGFAVIPLPITKACQEVFMRFLLSVSIGFKLAILFCWLEEELFKHTALCFLIPFCSACF